MASSIISDKYQVVIPKDVRTKVGLKKGQQVVMHPLVKEGAIMIVPKGVQNRAWYEQLSGLGKDAWGGVDPVAYVRSLRDEWES